MFTSLSSLERNNDMAAVAVVESAWHGHVGHRRLSYYYHVSSASAEIGRHVACSDSDEG